MPIFLRMTSNRSHILNMQVRTAGGSRDIRAAGTLEAEVVDELPTLKIWGVFDDRNTALKALRGLRRTTGLTVVWPGDLSSVAYKVTMSPTRSAKTTSTAHTTWGKPSTLGREAQGT